MLNLNSKPMNQKLTFKTQTQKMGDFPYNKLMQTLTKYFKKRKKKNIVRPRDAAKIFTLHLSISR